MKNSSFERFAPASQFFCRSCLITINVLSRASSLGRTPEGKMKTQPVNENTYTHKPLNSHDLATHNINVNDNKQFILKGTKLQEKLSNTK